MIDESGVEIAEIYYDCPWGTNEVNTSDPVNPDYLIAISGFNQTANGPLGKGKITVVSEAALASVRFISPYVVLTDFHQASGLKCGEMIMAARFRVR